MLGLFDYHTSITEAPHPIKVGFLFFELVGFSDTFNCQAILYTWVGVVMALGR